MELREDNEGIGPAAYLFWAVFAYVVVTFCMGVWWQLTLIFKHVRIL